MGAAGHVDEMVELRKQGLTCIEIGELFGVKHQWVGQLIMRKDPSLVGRRRERKTETIPGPTFAGQRGSDERRAARQRMHDHDPDVKLFRAEKARSFARAEAKRLALLEEAKAELNAQETRRKGRPTKDRSGHNRTQQFTQVSHRRSA